MTYSSRNFLISCGVGSEERAPAPRFSNRLSSAMMSLQTSTHSSQMKTVGPAISLRTSFWSLLQKEHRRTSVSPFFLTIVRPGVVRTRGPAARRPPALHVVALRPSPDHIVNNTVFLALIGRHDVVALGIVLDAFDGLARVEDQDFIDALAHAQDLAGRNINIGRLTGQTRHQRLVDDDPGVGQRKPLPLGPG